MEETTILGVLQKTGRGFALFVFPDANGVGCSLQESSAYRESGPMLWLGCNKPDPRVLIPGKGWTSIELPEGALCDTRMHLERAQVEALVEQLQRWLETGRLEGGESDGSS